MTEKEKLYLQAKQFYYEGNPIMSDYEFDILEEELKSLDSHVITIVGSSDLKELTFNHLSPMLSLDKEHATEDDLKIDEMIKFFGGNNIETEDSPKFDGSSCNLIYRDGKLDMCLTRGNGVAGQNITPKMKLIVPNLIKMKGIIEIRGEVVIPIKTFDEKYFGKPYQNERNMVSGVLGREDEFEDIVKDFHFIAYDVRVHENENYSFLDNAYDFLNENGFIIPVIRRSKTISEFNDSYKFFYDYRNTDCPYRLDGIVKKVVESKRRSYGENKKAPKWAIAIKFPAKEAKTKILSISESLGVTGEISYVAELEPVRLDGSTVSRVSITNFGNIINKGLLPGAEIIIVKSGDIIPYVKTVLQPIFDDYTKYIKTTCLSCGSTLEVNDIHMMCNNPECDGKKIAKLEYGIRNLGTKHIGGAAIENFYKAGIKNIIDFMDNDKFNETNLIKSGVFKDGRALEILFNARNKIKSLTLKQIINALKFDNVGNTISEQLANYIEGNPYSWSGLNREAIEPFLRNDSNEMKLINEFISVLKRNGIQIEETKHEIVSKDAIIYEMTGSPKDAGFNKKEDFVSFLSKHNYSHGKLNKDCNLLITDSMSSNSSKMSTAKKLGVEIITYDALIEKIATNQK